MNTGFHLWLVKYYTPVLKYWVIEWLKVSLELYLGVTNDGRVVFMKEFIQLSLWRLTNGISKRDTLSLYVFFL